MLVKSVANNETLMELKIEGIIELNPEDARLLLDLIAKSPIADQVVMRVGQGRVWYKLASRWGSAIKHNIHYGTDDTTAIAEKGNK